MTGPGTNLHVDDYPATIDLLRVLLGDKHDSPDGYRPHAHGITVDWSALDQSWLSTTEKAVVHIARGLATLEYRGTGPGSVDDAVLDAVSRIYGPGERP